MTMSLAEKELGSEFDCKFVGSLSTVDLAPVEISAVRKGGRCLNDVHTGIQGGMQSCVNLFLQILPNYRVTHQDGNNLLLTWI